MRVLGAWRPAALFLIIGHLLFTGLVVLASIHYLQRCIHVDSAAQIFKWVQLEGVEVEAYRFSAVLPQLAVKLFRAFHAELRTLLFVASITHVLIAYVIFILAAHVWRTRWIAAGCALAAVLCTRLTFYGIVLEANYLLCYPFLFAAVLHGPFRTTMDGKNIALITCALFMVLAVHPVGFLIVLYILALSWWELPERRKALAVLGSITVLWALLSRIFLPPTGYESGLYHSAMDGIGQLERLSELPSTDFLLGHTWKYTTHYLPTWILLGVLLVVFGMRRAWWSLFIVLGGTFGFTLLNVLTYHIGETAMMMEKNFLPLATMVALPLLMEIGRRPTRQQWWLAIPYLLVVFVQFRGISFASRPANERFERIVALTEELHAAQVPKAMVADDDLDAANLHIHWALQFETLLVSALDGPSHCVTAFVISAQQEVTGTTGVYLAPMDADYPTDQLLPNYFSLPAGPYVTIKPDLKPASRQ